MVSAADVSALFVCRLLRELSIVGMFIIVLLGGRLCLQWLHLEGVCDDDSFVWCACGF